DFAAWALSAQFRRRVPRPTMDTARYDHPHDSVRSRADHDRAARRTAPLLAGSRRHQSRGFHAAGDELSLGALSPPASTESTHGVLPVDLARRRAGGPLCGAGRSPHIPAGIRISDPDRGRIARAPRPVRTQLRASDSRSRAALDSRARRSSGGAPPPYRVTWG